MTHKTLSATGFAFIMVGSLLLATNYFFRSTREQATTHLAIELDSLEARVDAINVQTAQSLGVRSLRSDIEDASDALDAIKQRHESPFSAENITFALYALATFTGCCMTIYSTSQKNSARNHASG